MASIIFVIAYLHAKVSGIAPVIVGFSTWLFLHNYPIRGDYAALIYTALALGVFLATTVNKTIHPFLTTFTALSLHALSASAFTVLYRVSPWHPLASFPGPFLWRISSLYLVYVSFMGKRHLILVDMHRRYGPIVRIGPSQLSVNKLSANSVIYGAGTHMEKGDSYYAPGHTSAKALFFKQKTRNIHAERKRIWGKAFTGAAISNFIPSLERRTWELLHCIENRQLQSSSGAFDLSKAFSHWSYDFMGEMVFGGCNNLELMKSGDPNGLVEGGKIATVILDSFGQSPWLMDLVWYLPVGKSMVRLREVASAMMRNRVKADAKTTMRDLSSYLLEGETSSGERIPLDDLELDAVVAIQGGSDNTSITMALALYFMLSSNNGCYKKLQKELDNTFQDPVGPLSWETLASLPFLNATLNEALRLASPFYLPRMVPRGGVTIEDHYIPEGVTVAIAAYALQTSEENFYPDPLDFRAERWLPSGLGPGSVTEKSALFSFSSGPHVCIAKTFAHQEMRFVMARLVLAYDLELAPNFDVKAFRDGILNMRTTILKDPLMISAKRRPGINLPKST